MPVGSGCGRDVIFEGLGRRIEQGARDTKRVLDTRGLGIPRGCWRRIVLSIPCCIQALVVSVSKLQHCSKSIYVF